MRVMRTMSFKVINKTQCPSVLPSRGPAMDLRNSSHLSKYYSLEHGPSGSGRDGYSYFGIPALYMAGLGGRADLDFSPRHGANGPRDSISSRCGHQAVGSSCTYSVDQKQATGAKSTD